MTPTNHQHPELGRIGIWAGELDDCTAAGLREAVATVEDLGFGTLWFPETAGREAMAQAAMLLSQTRRIVVAAGSTDIYARDAVTTAAAQRTLEEAFPGRFLLGLWDSHPSLAEQVRGHRFGPPLPTMRAYLDALDAAPFGPPGTAPSPHRVLAAQDPGMLALAAERAWGAHVLGMPVAHTHTARAILGPTAMLAVTQLCVLGPNRSHTAAPARDTAAAALPNRRTLLRALGYEAIDPPEDRLVDAIVAHGTAEDIARRVHEHLDAGADHVSLHLLTATPGTPPTRQWRQLAAQLLP
ncbi:putative F420-dependent oxidoreductase [Kitasatospora gansuensis]|uniref:Putative F420-dependent oxidoreductase n=1 Tax=Kitasatospora gansuensis TaxID=258050 RepID=A0A7W7WM85_9ACTN|nr:TIGR03620 family F420-dependent LLM class oxidoreductase [Kitasatospora gansuensis]MBB4951524.1 putative F420-dependent oxidoreductase [Kitasatospora gansuensis]